jgi:hypothetical protein
MITLEEMKKFSGESQFAILFHDLPVDSVRKSHWDLLLKPPEVASNPVRSLICFEVNDAPEMWVADVDCVRLPDHRLVYLEYEGPISGGRGDVSRVCRGACDWKCDHAQTVLCITLKIEELKAVLPSGSYQLRLHPPKTESDASWALTLVRETGSR